MKNRFALIQSYPDSVFISIHQNQYVKSEYSGAQMFYTTKNKVNFRPATIMQGLFADLQLGNDRDIKLIDNNRYLFKGKKQPAVLI